jgi:hypothetical protein
MRLLVALVAAVAVLALAGCGFRGDDSPRRGQSGPYIGGGGGGAM